MTHGSAWFSKKVSTLAVLAFLLSGCGSNDEADQTDFVPVDSTLVELLADLHLADARASAFEDSAAVSPRDSVLTRRDLSEADLAETLRDLAEDPDVASATYSAVETRLSLERQGGLP